MKLTFDKELNLALYRHWSLHESLHHTIYTAAKFKIWTLKGKQRLFEFLAELGLPLVQCKQRFTAMDLGLRNEIVKIFEAKADKYKLEQLTQGSFSASAGFRQKFSASDIVYTLLALMEHHLGADSSKTANDDSFLQALDCLSRSQTRLLEEGILAAKSLMQTIMEQVRGK